MVKPCKSQKGAPFSVGSTNFPSFLSKIVAWSNRKFPENIVLLLLGPVHTEIALMRSVLRSVLRSHEDRSHWCLLSRQIIPNKGGQSSLLSPLMMTQYRVRWTAWHPRQWPTSSLLRPLKGFWNNGVPFPKNENQTETSTILCLDEDVSGSLFSYFYTKYCVAT